MNTSAKKFGLSETIAWYDEHAEEYAAKVNVELNTDVYSAFTAQIPSGAKILDLGCGSGRYAKHFFEDGYQVVGIDISHGLIEVARKNNPDMIFIEDSFLELPFDDNSFDAIWSYASLVHLETVADVLQTLRECRRVLKPKGVLMVYVKQKLDDNKTSVVADSLSNHNRFFRWYTAEELRHYFIQTGFKVMAIQENQSDSMGRDEVKWLFALVQ